jgi:hypothetical protein
VVKDPTIVHLVFRSCYGLTHATIVARSDLVGPSTLSTRHSEIDDTEHCTILYTAFNCILIM